MRRLTGVGESMIDVIAGAGVKRLYTVPGESFMEVLDAAEQHPGLRQFSTRHESGASFMAEADGKLTGVPAVAMATRGPGASNLSLGVQTAYHDGTPMLVLVGDVETKFMHRGAFQEVDLAAFYAPITKLSMTATRGDTLPDLVGDALRIATTGRPGPVMISLPADLIGEELSGGARRSVGSAVAPRPLPSPAEVAEAVRLIQKAEHPVIIAGSGAQGARFELIAAAERFGIGVYSAFRRQDVFPNDHPLYLGHLDVAPPAETVSALEDADLVLIVGCHLDQITTQRFQLPRSTAEVIQVDCEPSTIGANVQLGLGIVADPAKMLVALLESDTFAQGQESRRERWRQAHELFVRSTIPGESRSASGIDPAHVIASMARVFPDDTIVTSDAGNFSGFLHRYWTFRNSRSQAAPANGAMGYAVPGAVGAKAAFRDRKVLAVAGDGGFLMTGQEIETAVRYDLPITVAVFRNGMYGTIAMHQARRFGRSAATDIGPVDLAAFARSLGADGITVSEPGQLEDSMAFAAMNDKVTVLDIVTDPDLISPTATLSGMLASTTSAR